MTEILQFIAWWLVSGFIGWILGMIVDRMFYKKPKIELGVILLSMVIGPLVYLICFNSLLQYYLNGRKERKNRIPENLKECFVFLDDLLSEEDKEEAKKDPEFGVRIHHTFGRTLRNDWDLWTGGKLKDYFISIGIHHADDMSGIILTSYHRYLNDEDIKLDEQVKFSQEYWRKQKEEDAQGK